MSDHKSSRLVSEHSIKLVSDNWYSFADHILTRISSACNLDFMLRNPNAFSIPYQNEYLEQEKESYTLEVEYLALVSKQKRRDELFADACKNYRVTLEDVKSAIDNKTAELAGLCIVGDQLTQWKQHYDMINNGTAKLKMEDTPVDINRVTYEGLMVAYHAHLRTNEELVTNMAAKKKLANDHLIISKSYTSARSVLEQEKGVFLAQLFSKGADALIDSAYYEQLEGNEVVWERIMLLRSSRKLSELWSTLKTLQDSDYPHSDITYGIKLIRMDPSTNETLDAFNVRFDANWKMAKSATNSCISEETVVYRYRDVLRDFYGSPIMNRILEPYFYAHSSEPNRKMPSTLNDFKNQIRRAIKAANDVSSVPIKLIASRGSIATPAIADIVSSVTSNSNTSFPQCIICKRFHPTLECKCVDPSRMKELTDLVTLIRKETNNTARFAHVTQSIKPTVSTTPSALTTWSQRNKDKDSKNPSQKAAKSPRRPVVSYVEEIIHPSDSLFDEYDQCMSVREVVSTAQTSDRLFVQLDNGSNTHIFNSLAFFVNKPVPSDRSFVGVYADSPKKLGMVGEAHAFGRAYYDASARNIISQSRLEEEGFDMCMIKDISNPRVTTAWSMSKGGKTVTFFLSDGIFYAPTSQIILMAQTLQTAVVAVSTRGNPFGIPNSSMLPTSLPLSEPIHEAEPDAMDIDEFETPVDPILPIIDQPLDVHTHSNGFELSDPDNFVDPVFPTTTALPSSTFIHHQVQEATQLVPPSTIPFYVPSLGRRLTRLEEGRYTKAANLHIASGHAGRATEMQLLQGCHLLNTDLTPADIKIFHEISGACLGCVKGKMLMPRQVEWEIRSGALVGEYWELDLGYFGCKTYVIMVEVVTNFAVLYPIMNRKATTLLPIAQQWKQLLIKTMPRLFDPTVDGSVTIKIKCDREIAFNVFESVVRPVHMARTSAEGHASRVEVLIRILKERARAIIYSLPYKLPASRYGDLISFIIDMKNYLPSTTKSPSTPMEAIFSKRLREEDMLQLHFGQMVAVIVPPNQRGPKSDAVAQEGIIVGFETQTPANVKVYIPSTNHIVSRSKVIKISSPALIKTLNEMSLNDIVIDPFPLDQASSTPTSDPTLTLIAASVEGGMTSVLPPAVNMSTLDNMSTAQAIRTIGREAVLQSTLTELDNMARMGVFKFIEPKIIDPEALVLPSKIIHKVKFKDGKYYKNKSRLVSRGDLQPAGSYGETKSPTADKASLFMICSLNKLIKGNIYSVDVPAAFLFAKLKEKMYMLLPKEITPLIIGARAELSKYLDKQGRLTVQLMKSIYGLKQSPLNWYVHLVRVLEDAGFLGCITDRCVFYRNDDKGTTHIIFHVDDVFISSNAPIHINILKTAFNVAFGPMEWEENKFTFLGMYFCLRDDSSIDVDMAAYTSNIVDKHWTPEIGDEFKKTRGIINPSSDELFFNVDQNSLASEQEVSDFKSITMELLYSTTVRIDILKECVCAASQSHAPGTNSWKLIRQLIAYLKVNPCYVINFGADSSVLTMYADAGYAVHPDAQSHTGIFVTLGTNSGPILVKSKKQSLVTQSSTESELCALVDGIKRAIPLAKLLVELGINKTVFIMAMQDNTSTITIARMGEGMHGKAKHFLVRFHFLRELLDQGIIDISHVGTDFMIPDFQTKGMTGIKFQFQILRALYHGDLEGFKEACTRAKQRILGNMINA